MKEIQLTRKLKTIVDDDSFEELSKYKWFAKIASNKKSFYAARWMRVGEDRICVYIHREVALKCKRPTKYEVDHINGNTLDNRAENLRVVEQKQNKQNRRKSDNCKNKYKGVSKLPSGRWRAQIKVDRKGLHLGVFDTQEIAAMAYNVAARHFFGEFASLNNI